MGFMPKQGTYGTTTIDHEHAQKAAGPKEGKGHLHMRRCRALPMHSARRHRMKPGFTLLEGQVYARR